MAGSPVPTSKAAQKTLVMDGMDRLSLIGGQVFCFLFSVLARGDLSIDLAIGGQANIRWSGWPKQKTEDLTPHFPDKTINTMHGNRMKNLYTLLRIKAVSSVGDQTESARRERLEKKLSRPYMVSVV
jgi:hypothetical protein